MFEETEEITENTEETSENGQDQTIDSKYRLIILAAQRSKQLQRGATPRVELDPRKSKPTRIALRELENGEVRFDTLTDGQTAGK
ncbi:MAG: DNA-directed RNA polymerase subunit omega [Acidobacteria bacterium]|nr:DNA-directed RNA polymerase subunit omega [Acidobacteriota bacterium]